MDETANTNLLITSLPPATSDGEILNRVSNSTLITFDLEEYYTSGARVVLDIKDWLFQGQILKEKEFREFVTTHDWSYYKNKYVAITCSTDAIIPTWAYMLLSVSLQPVAESIFFGSVADLEIQLFMNALNRINWQTFKDAKVVIKGCSKVDVPVAIYVEATHRLRAVAASIMFGEPCSTVPLFKRKITKPV
jgi:hypothetical protein